MSQPRLPPPPPACLVRPYPSSQKGGTIIAESVTDRATHERLRVDPDGYRPAACPGCLHGVLHVHDYRERTLRGEDDEYAGVLVIARYLCAGCRAAWQILPAFVCRHLWRSWGVVTAGCSAAEKLFPKVPKQSRERWRARVESQAVVLAQLLAASASERLTAVAGAVGVGLTVTRGQLIDAWEVSFATAAGIIHRLMPGVRLM
jgi:hypothetical protein